MQILKLKDNEDAPENYTGIVEIANGSKFWYLNGVYHREDGPAREWADGTKEWYLNGKYHRVDGPAIENAEGSKFWYLNGKLHREDGPVLETANGYKEYHLNGKYLSEKQWKKEVKKLKESKEPVVKVLKLKNNEDAPDDYTGIIEWEDGEKAYRLNGKLHREDGPAIEGTDGTKIWHLNGKCHREDGPALEWSDGYKAWFLNGKSLSEEQWKKEVKKLKPKRIPKNKTKAGTIKVLKLDDDVAAPKNYTGIVAREDGQKEWYLNGAWHREDGPAIEYKDGSKEWWVNGKIHREDGPAMEYSDGHKEWWVNGKIHCEDGPARIYKNGSKEWWLNGEHHREDGPAIERYYGEEEWYLNGKRHREDGPAVELSDGQKEWWIDGKLHREDGPALTTLSGEKQWWLKNQQLSEEEWKKKVTKVKLKRIPKDKTNAATVQVLKLDSQEEIPVDYTGIIEWDDGAKSWHLNGEYYRVDGPAIEYADGSKEWYVNGKFHREDGPAVEYADDGKEWYLNGLRHREDGPAIENANGQKEWWLNGLRHREDGPAIENANGQKEWWLNGKIYPEKDWKKEVEKLKKPKESAIKVLELKGWQDAPEDYTGIAERGDGQKEWYLNGKLHREDGPAVEDSYGDKQWYLNGNAHRVDGPAIEGTNGYKEWWVNGCLHREDGPAREWLNGSKEWWLNGRNLTEEEWKKEVQKLKKPKEPAMKVLRLKDREDVPKNYTGIVEYSDGSKEWYLNGKEHREDGPAIESSNGNKFWCVNGEYHREDGPAREWANGSKEWFLNDRNLTEDDWKKEVEKLKESREPKKPAVQVLKLGVVPADYTGIVEYSDGKKEWYVNGKFHREDGPAIEYKNGSKEWFLNGKWHREDGPAIEYANGGKEWYLNGKHHRVDGPACEYADGTKSWDLNGESFFTEEEWKKAVQKLKKLKEPAVKVLKLKLSETVPDDYTGIAEWEGGSKAWFLNGNFHREDGPAIDHSNGSKSWYLNGKLHREDGPAFECKDGSNSWWLNGRNLTEEEWKKAVNPIMDSTSVKQPLLSIIKSDSREVTKRVIVNKGLTLIRAILVEILTKDLKDKQKEILKTQVSKFLASEFGKAILSFVLGCGIPYSKNKLPQKYHGVLDEVAKEARIQGESTIMLEALNKFQPLFSTVGNSLLSSFDTLIGNPTSQEFLRIDTSETESFPHVLNTEEKEVEEEVSSKQMTR